MTGKRIDIYINGKEQRAGKQTHTTTVNASLPKGQRQFKGERVVFSTSGAEKTGHPYAKI